MTPAASAIRPGVAVWNPSEATIAWATSRICSRRFSALIRRRAWGAVITLDTLTYNLSVSN
ncbi:hypothetical protein GCM10027262_16760 [Nocardia tengchongensis]